MREPSIKIVSILSKILPYMIFAAAMFIVLFLLAFGRSDLALRSLYLLIPISIAALMIIIKPDWFRKSSLTPSPHIKLSPASFRNLVLVFMLLNTLSISLLVGENVSTLGYFLFIGLIAAIVFIEILGFGGEENSGRKGVILFQIVIISANIILGQTLRLPLFFGFGDVLAHIYNINTIVETGYITSTMAFDYQYFPAFHIFGAIGNIMSGMDIEVSYFVFNNLFFLISIPIVYLLTGRITRNPYLPMIAALLYAISREAIFNGMYMITRVMAFVFCFLILYLLIRSRANIKLRSLAIFLVLPLVITHHTTLIHFSVILLVIVILEILLYRKRYVGFNFLAFFTLAYLGYWVCASYPFFKSTVEKYAASQEIAQITLPAAERSLYLTFTNNADAIVVAFLAVCGIVGLIHARRELLVMGTAFIIFSILGLIMYFPVISSFLNRTLLSSRLQLLVTPFIAFVAAGGLLLLVGKSLNTRTPKRPIIRVAVAVIIIFFLSLSSTVIQANFTDFNLQKILGNENRQYFTDSELAAFDFAEKYGSEGLYYGDYAAIAYLQRRLGLLVRQTEEVFNPDSVERGFFVFRNYELQSRGKLGFTFWGQDGAAEQTYTYYSGESPDIQALWEKQNKIFDCGSMYIYMRKPS